MSCIPSNPDITGIGVRAAIYAQNFFALIPAARVLWDGKITHNEIDTIQEQSSTILVTAFALLFTTVIQARGATGLNVSDVLEHPNKGESQVLQKELNMVLGNPVFWIGSLHLSVMGIIGVWLWSYPETFGHSDPQCSIHMPVIFFGGRVALTSNGLKYWSIIVYGVLLLMPGLNMILPSTLIVLPIRLIRRLKYETTRWRTITSVTPGFTVLIIINIFFLANTEVAIRGNQSLLGETVNRWSFGQILALMLLLVPAWSFVGILLERRDSREKKIRELVDESIDGKEEKAQELLNQQPDVTVKNYALLMASANGHQEVVKILYDTPQVHDYSGGQVVFLLAAYQQHMSIVQWLAEKGLGIEHECEENTDQTPHTSSEYFHAEAKFLEPLKSMPQEGSEDVVKVLAELSMGIKIKDIELLKALANAAGNGLETVVNVLKDSDVFKNSEKKYELGETPLHKAAAGGHLSIVKKFIQAQDFDINSQTDTGYTPLHKAACGGKAKVARWLIEHGANRRAKSKAVKQAAVL
ncbi:hypothetical protein H0H87_004719 [Tephrocybe sp. NHM501043]|nr:hypothetical protein H0H87_004719 [Tephrocybe sp. NHM501043]